MTLVLVSVLKCLRVAVVVMMDNKSLVALSISGDKTPDQKYVIAIGRRLSAVMS